MTVKIQIIELPVIIDQRCEDMSGIDVQLKKTKSGKDDILLGNYRVTVCTGCKLPGRWSCA